MPSLSLCLLFNIMSQNPSYCKSFLGPQKAMHPRRPNMLLLPSRQDNNSDVNAHKEKKRAKFCINDHIDILIEILKRLDGRSLGVAACVCRLWCTIARNDSLWEDLCFRHISSPPSSGVRPVVVALGGYKRLYMECVRPLLSRLGWNRLRLGGGEEMQRLSLSLFCVDYYERLGKLGGGDASTASSLMFLCKSVNV